VNVAYDTDAFVNESVVSLTFIPSIPFEKVIVSMSEIFGLHKVIADILKLIETPTCASKQRLSGSITGGNPHVG
jgi:hypothetical protein